MRIVPAAQASYCLYHRCRLRGAQSQESGHVDQRRPARNPSRLEPRLGRIKRYGQQRKTVDMANLIYTGTVDEKVYRQGLSILFRPYQYLVVNT